MKKIWFRSRLVLGTATLLLGCSGEPAAPPTGSAPAAGPSGLTLEVDAYVAHRDRSVDLPTLSWLQPRHGVPVGSNPKDIALATLRGLATPYRLSEAALQSAQLRDVHDAGNGPLIAHFDQQVSGMEVFRSSIKIGMDRTATPVVASGYLAPRVQPMTTSFALDETAAVAAAFRAMQDGKVVVDNVRRTDEEAPQGRYATLAVSGSAGGGVTMNGPARSNRLWYPTGAGLLPAYYVEITAGRSDSTDASMFAFVVSAVDGNILFTKDLTASDSFSYRVWADNSGRYTPWDSPVGNDFSPHPTGVDDPAVAPTGVKPAPLVKLQNAPFNYRNDPWLPTDATDASGNNVFAYADLAAPDGFSPGDLRVTATAPGTFDRTFDPTADSSAAVAPAVGTHLFYVLNFMHDYFYEAGWTESSLNSQKDNFGRGGLGGDAIKAETQDYGGTNNANASTPADGGPPRIQMYLWTPLTGKWAITSPAAQVGDLQIGTAAYNPPKYNVTGDLVVVDDGSGATGSLGCGTTFVNAGLLAGKLALIDRGTCSFLVKTQNAQANGAIGVVMVNNRLIAAGGGPFGMSGSDPTITIPTVGISQEAGDPIKASLTAGTAVTVKLMQDSIVRDGSIDSGIVSHEWGHTMSNRLIGNGSGISNTQGSGMGEGWSDFVAMLTTVRPEDATAPANVNWNGAYPVGAWATWYLGNKTWYEGIRRYPYSADMNKNPLMFQHVQEGVPLPAMPIPAFGADGNGSSEVHSTGEVWQSMLWDCYVGLLRDTARYTFDQANLRMRQYLVASLKLTPNAPTILEARDAVLAAAFATDAQDFQLFWKAFARRGAGVGAVGPERYSPGNLGVTESYGAGNNLQIESIGLDDSVKSCDRDGILDNDETGVLTVKLRNTGTGDLAATTVKVTSSLPAVTLNGASFVMLTVPTIRATQSATLTVNIAMSGASGVTPFDLTVDATDPSLTVPGPRTQIYQALGNFDNLPRSGTIGSGDLADSAWTVLNDTNLDTTSHWERLPGARSTGIWHCPDHDSPADYSLLTPPLQVKASGSFSFTLTHRYDWEVDNIAAPTQYFDGSVIEISTDNGMNWTDLGPKLTPNGYNATLAVGDQSNPLNGRAAFSGRSVGFEDGMGQPGYITTTANLGTAYAGKTVRIRFRGGMDSGAGFSGWFVPQVVFQNLQNTPFSTQIADRGLCVPAPANSIEVRATSDVVTAPSGYLVQLSASIVQSPGQPVTFTWSQVSGPPVTLSSTTGPYTNFNAPAVSTQTPVVLQVVASDGTLQSSPQMVNLTIVPDGGPITLNNGGCSYGGSLPAPASSLSGLLLAGAALLARRRRK